MTASSSVTARTERLVAKRKLAAAEKQAHTLAFIERLLASQGRVTFVDVQRGAGVSTWFVYNNPVVRAAIEDAMREQRTARSIDAVKPADDRTIRGLRAELADARAEIRDLREERERLRRRLQRNLGDQISTMEKRELLERLRVLEDENNQLQTSLRATTEDHAAIRRELDNSQTELEGTRLALRQMVRQQSSALT